VGLEYLAAGRDGHIHHLLVLLQGVKAAAHVPMEVVPRQQVLVDGVGIRVGLLLLVGGLLLLLVLVELLLGGLVLGGRDVDLLRRGGWRAGARSGRLVGVSELMVLLLLQLLLMLLLLLLQLLLHVLLLQHVLLLLLQGMLQGRRRRRGRQAMGMRRQSRLVAQESLLLGLVVLLLLLLMLLLLLLMLLLLLLLLACVLLDLDHVLLLLLLPLAHQLLLELVLLHGEIIDALRELGHVAVAVELAVGEHGLQLEFVVPGGSAGGGGQFPLGGQGGPLLLSPDQLIDVHVGSTGGRRNGRGYDWIILKDTVVEGLLQGLCGREETQRGIVYLVAKVHIHQCEEGPFAPLGLLGHLDGLVLLQQIVPLLDDL